MKEECAVDKDLLSGGKRKDPKEERQEGRTSTYGPSTGLDIASSSSKPGGDRRAEKRTVRHSEWPQR